MDIRDRTIMPSGTPLIGGMATLRIISRLYVKAKSRGVRVPGVGFRLGLAELAVRAGKEGGGVSRGLDTPYKTRAKNSAMRS
jgi:hypothetical protein